MEPTPTETWRKPTNPILKVLGILVVLAILGYGAYYLYTNYGQPKKADQTVEAPPTVTIKVTDKGFDPATVTVKPGTVVIWEVSASKPVVVAANPYPKDDSVEGLKSEQLGNGASYRHKFEDAGTFGYHDDLNPTVNGTIIVR